MMPIQTQPDPLVEAVILYGRLSLRGLIFVKWLKSLPAEYLLLLNLQTLFLSDHVKHEAVYH